MNASTPTSGTADQPTQPASQGSQDGVINRIIKRFGGRHLIFRTTLESPGLIPHPYALVSDFTGPVWFFYGLGQIWLTHRKHKEFDGWTARVPRLGGAKLIQLIDQLSDSLTRFTHHCNEHGIEGTVVLEAGVIEFHWTFGYALEKEKMKPEKASVLDREFQILADQFLLAKAKLRI